MFDIHVDTGIAKYSMTNLGPQGSDALVQINGQGPINFTDVGTKKLGPNRETYGVCISFKDTVWAFRYEGQGQLNVTYDPKSQKLDLKSTNGSVALLTT